MNIVPLQSNKILSIILKVREGGVWKKVCRYNSPIGPMVGQRILYYDDNILDEAYNGTVGQVQEIGWKVNRDKTLIMVVLLNILE